MTRTYRNFRAVLAGTYREPVPGRIDLERNLHEPTNRYESVPLMSETAAQSNISTTPHNPLEKAE